MEQPEIVKVDVLFNTGISTIHLNDHQMGILEECFRDVPGVESSHFYDEYLLQCSIPVSISDLELLGLGKHCTQMEIKKGMDKWKTAHVEKARTLLKELEE